MPSKTKYQEILEYIRIGILNGEYRAGDRLPTDGQLMRQFNTSRPTAARAMRELEREGFLERRTGSGSFVLTRNQSSLVGLLTPEVGSAELFEPICSEIASQCQKHHLSLLWADSAEIDSEDPKQRAMELCERFVKLKVSGVFFAPVEFSEEMILANREIAETLDAAGISVVLLDRDLERLPERSRFDLISVDNFRIGYLQTQHLIDCGGKRIVYVARDHSAPTIDIRMAGYKIALEQNRLQNWKPITLVGNPDEEPFLNSILVSKPDSIVCSNDNTAAMLLQSLVRNNIKVPQDIRLIGVDDIRIAELTSVPLSTVRQPCADLGRVAVATMVRRIENRKMGPQTVFVGVDLVIRDSCGFKNTESAN